jgi:dihydroneopterin aldolase
LDQGTIICRGIRFEARHGASADEQLRAHEFEVDIEVCAPVAVRGAAESDRLVDAIDYRELCGLAVRVGTESTCHLIETVASRILEAVSVRHPGCDVTVEVRKLAPPCPGAPRDCAVRLSRSGGG